MQEITNLDPDNKFTPSLYSSGDKVQRIFEITGIGLWELDLNTKNSFWTKETFRIFGIEPHDGPIPFSMILERIHPDDRDRVHDVVSQALTTQIDADYRVLLQGGEVRYVRAQAALESGSTSNSIIGTVQDMTKQKRTEIQLGESKQRYESLKRFNPSAICSLGKDGFVMGANPAFERITGYSLDDLQNVSLVDALFDPSDIELAKETFHSASVENVEMTIRHKNGQQVDVSVTSVPIVIGVDTIGIYVIFNDITQQKLDRAKLLDIERLYRLISEHSQDIISITTPDGICRYVSPSVLDLLGYEPRELIGHQMHSFFHPDDLGYVDSIGKKISMGENIDRFTCRVRCKNGAYLWYETAIKVVRNVRGEIVQTVGVGRDVSEQMVLQESLEQAVSIAGLGQWEWNIPTQTVSVSNQMCEILGIKSTREIHLNEFISFVHPEEVEVVRADIYKSLETGNPFDRVCRIVPREGSIRYVHAQAEVIFDVDIGSIPLRVVGTSQDITERKTVELALNRSTERYRRMIDNSLDAIGIVENGKWVFMNQVGLRMFGETDDEHIVGKSLYDFVHQDHREECAAHVHTLLNGQPVGIVEQRWMRSGGEMFHANVLGFPFSETAVQLTVRDVTEQKQAEETIMNAEKLSVVGQLAAGIAHEIRNPLTALSGFTQMLQQNSGVEHKPYFDIMRGEFNRIEMIINEFLILAKPQATNFKPANVRSLLCEIVTLLEGQAVYNNVVIETNLGVDEPMVECDPNQLKQVFINVVKNAIEAMSTGGTVLLTLTTTNDDIRIECSDSGSGIPKELLDKLGTPFFSTKEKGTGLGFMVSRKIIESHKGTIHVDSELGKGTVIRITLPSYKQ